jgi:hypothetical protein
VHTKMVMCSSALARGAACTTTDGAGPTVHFEFIRFEVYIALASQVILKVSNLGYRSEVAGSAGHENADDSLLVVAVSRGSVAEKR